MNCCNSDILPTIIKVSSFLKIFIMFSQFLKKLSRTEQESYSVFLQLNHWFRYVQNLGEYLTRIDHLPVDGRASYQPICHNGDMCCSGGDGRLDPINHGLR